MSWPASLFSAILTGILEMFISGFIAALAVDWYHMSGREGASGYFVLLLGILGFAAGLVIGLIVARMVAAGAHPGFFRALAISLATVSALGLLSAGVTRSLADIPPTLDGETMLLQVEVRWPQGQQAAPVAVGPDEASVSLHSIPRFSHTVRASRSGPLWIGDTHLVDGRWVVPGAVAIFTSRGSRMLTVDVGDQNHQGFGVPLPARPGKRNLEWSDWLPKFRPGVQASPNLLSFRFRALKASQPVRSETIGPFEILTMAGSFYEVQQEQRTLRAAYASFGFRHRGLPLDIEGKTPESGDTTERFARVDDVALLAGPRTAFLIHADSPGSSGHCFLLAEEAERARIEYVAECSTGQRGEVLTSDTAVFRARVQGAPIPGRIDLSSYERPGLYRIGHAVLDTRKLKVWHYQPDSSGYDIPSVPPLSLSPDRRSFVTFGNENGSEPGQQLLVTDFVANRSYALPIDPARMRYAKFDSLDPAWLDHHFEWRRENDGVDRLVERRHFVPLPWQGELSVEGDGHSSYQWQKGTEGLRGALLEFLVTEFKAERQPADSGDYEIPVLIDGNKVNVAFSSDGDYVMVSMDRGSVEPPTLIATIGKRFDAVLVTGRYNGLFVP